MECGGSTLRKVLQKYIIPSDEDSVYKYLTKREDKLIDDKHPFHYMYKNILYPQNKKSNIDVWDISVICHVFNCAVIPEIKEDWERKALQQGIREIREVKNNLIHAPDSKLSDPIYAGNKQKLTDGLDRLMSLLDDKLFKEQIDKEMGRIEKGTFIKDYPTYLEDMKKEGSLGPVMIDEMSKVKQGKYDLTFLSAQFCQNIL